MFTHAQRDHLVDQLLSKANSILTAKGHDYGGQEDAIRDFTLIGETAGVSPEVVCLTFLFKHITAIANEVRGTAASTEPLEERICDAINYLCLLHCITATREPT